MRAHKNLFAVAVCLLTMLAGVVLVAAQEKQVNAEADAKQRQQGIEQTMKVLTYELSASRAKVVKGAPYSATAVTESIQTLSDGNQIVQKKEAAYYRDGEGRTRIEQRLDVIGKWTTADEPRRIIMISDPVSGFHYSLDPQDRTALKISQGSPYKLETDEGAKQKREVEIQLTRAMALARSNQKIDESSKSQPEVALKQSGAPRKVSNSAKTTTSLGKQTVEGIEAEGTRVTTTIPAGQIGNTLPIEIVDEQWFSPELQFMVMTRHRDPRSGELTWRMTNINRSEPDPALFQIPADYKLVDQAVVKPLKLKTEQQ